MDFRRTIVLTDFEIDINAQACAYASVCGDGYCCKYSAYCICSMEECVELCSHGDLMPNQMGLPPKVGEKVLDPPLDEHYIHGYSKLTLDVEGTDKMANKKTSFISKKVNKNKKKSKPQTKLDMTKDDEKDLESLNEYIDSLFKFQTKIFLPTFLMIKRN